MDAATDTSVAPGAPAAPPGGEASFVLIDIGAVLVAVAVEDVVQGIAWPARLDVLPRRASAACGVFDYLGQPVAMLDLALWVNLGVANDGAAVRTPRYPRALIVRSGGHMVAIAADAVRGMQRIALRDVTRLSHDDDFEEIFHSVARCPSIEGVASVLDVQRLMALARTWSGDSGNAIAAASTDTLTGQIQQQQFGVVAGNDCRIAFPVADLVEVLPLPALALLQSPLTEGLCMWRGRHVPVTSIGRCFPHLAASGTAPAPLLALFERDGLALGVVLDQVPVIQSFATPEAHSLSAVADSEGALVHLVGMDALYSRFPERLLSRETLLAATAGMHGSNQAGAAWSASPTASSKAASKPANSNASSHIVFEADGVASTPIDGIEAVLNLPPLAPGATHIAWRGNALPLHDLRAQASDKGAVIVVQGEQAPLGFIVDAVQALVQARAGRVSRLSMPGRGVVDLLTTASATGGQTTYSTRDLAQMARSMSAAA